MSHPITAGGGDNIAYEVHVYNPTSDFQWLFQEPAASIPVVIGEFAPDGTYMTDADLAPMMDSAESLEIPYLAWTFHMRCGPSLLEDQSGSDGCGAGMPLRATGWGTTLKSRLAATW